MARARSRQTICSICNQQFSEGEMIVEYRKWSGEDGGISTLAIWTVYCSYLWAIRPFASGGNLLLAQTKSQSIGVSGSANALRTETLQYTYRNIDILTHADKTSCVKNGFFLDGDLRIKDFIYDNATIAAGGTVAFAGGAGKSWERPIFNVFTEEVTFVAAFGGSFTPTWKLATIQANASSNLLIAERTNTNDLVITLGPLDPKQSKDAPVQLSQAAQSQHLTRVQASAIAVSIQGQSH